MNLINQKDIDTIVNFIDLNEMDMIPINNGIVKFNVKSFDDMIFTFFEYNSEYILVKYDKSKDLPGGTPYEYYNYKSLPLMLEQLKLYDDSISKTFWTITNDSIQIGFIKESYVDNWVDEFVGIDKYKIESTEQYRYIVFEDKNLSPKLKSTFNDYGYTEVNKLNFEIHPISVIKNNESYLLKLLINNEPVLKEYVNYIVKRRKGLKLLINELIKSV